MNGRFMLRLCIAAHLLLTFNSLVAQNSVVLSLQSLQQNLPKFDEQSIVKSNQFILVINNQTNFNNLPVELSISVKGNGISITSNDNLVGKSIIVPAFSNKILYSRDLAPYLDVDNLNFSGFNKEDYLNNVPLPQGLYTLCFEAKAYSSDANYTPKSACVNLLSQLMDPPIIITPKNREQVDIDLPYLFSWQPRHFSTGLTEYEFEIYEDNNLPINELINNYNPVYAVKTYGQSILFNNSARQLVKNTNYVCVVKVLPGEQYIPFKNNGYSNEVYFQTTQKSANRSSTNSCEIPNGTVFINEIANGEGLNNDEFVELVVVGSPRGETVDLEGWIIDDNNFNKAEIGNEAGHIRLGSCANNLPKGTIVLIYSDCAGCIHPKINPANDGLHNGVLQIPFSSECIIKYESCPDHQADNTSYDCSPASNNNQPFWSQYLPMRNSKDVLQIRNPYYGLEHALIWVTNDYEYSNSFKTIHFGQNVGNTFIGLTKGTTWFDQGNYSIGSFANATPGTANSFENDNLINAIKNNTGGSSNFNISCSQQNDLNGAKAKITVNGSTGPYEVKINNQSFTSSLNPIIYGPLSPGTYAISVRDELTSCIDYCDLTIVCPYEVGTSCDDYNDCTINDKWSADCECKGEPLDTVKIIYSVENDTLCSYCVPVQPAYYGYSLSAKSIVDALHVRLPNGNIKVFTAANNQFGGFNFPYCWGPSNSCQNFPIIIKDLVDHYKQWLVENNFEGQISGDKTCGVGFFIKDSDVKVLKLVGSIMENDSMIPFTFPAILKGCIPSSNPTSYKLTATATCDSITSYLWSNGETTSSIEIDSLGPCYSVTLTCYSAGNQCEISGVFGSNCNCIVGAPCDDGDPCTTGGSYNEKCQCIEENITDTDGDDVCDPYDICQGFDDHQDDNGNGIPDGCEEDPPCLDNLSIDVDTLGSELCEYCVLLPTSAVFKYVNLVEKNGNSTTLDLQNLCTTFTTVNFNDFSSNQGIWQTTIRSARVIDQVNSPSPTASLKMWDDTPDSYIVSSALNLLNNNKVKISFKYRAINISDQGSHFSLYYSTDNGNTYKFIDSWVYGVDFQNNQNYDVSTEISAPFGLKTKFKFVNYINSQNAEAVFIDDILISKCKISNNQIVNTINDYISSHNYMGVASLETGNWPDCGGNGLHLKILNSTIKFNTITYDLNDSTKSVSFNSPNCGNLAPGEMNFRIVANIECEDPIFMWNTGQTSDTIIVPTLSPLYVVTVTCKDSCIYIGKIGSGECTVGAPCSAGPCYNNDGYYDENCNCLGSTLMLGSDLDGDGLCGTDDPCPCDKNNVDSDGDGICDCLECPPAKIKFKHTSDSVEYCNISLPIYNAFGKNLTHAFVDGVDLSTDPIFKFPYCFELSSLECELPNGSTLPSLKKFKYELMAYLSQKGHKGFSIKDSIINGSTVFMIQKIRLGSIILKFGPTFVSGTVHNCKKYPEGLILSINSITNDNGELCTPAKYIWSNGATTSTIKVRTEFAGYCVTVTCADSCKYTGCTSNSGCLVGASCTSGDTCIVNGKYDENCNCISDPKEDQDHDGVSNKCDKCEGYDDHLDLDFDGIPNACDICIEFDTIKLKKCDYCLDLLPNWLQSYSGYYVSGFNYIDPTTGQSIWVPFISGFCMPIQSNFCPGGSQINQMVLFIQNWINTNGHTGTVSLIVATPFNQSAGCSNKISLKIVGSDIQFENLQIIYSGDGVANLPFIEKNCIQLGYKLKRKIIPCDDNDPCTINDSIDENCNCVGEFQDEDHDGVCDPLDKCLGHPNYMDADTDGVPDGCDEIEILCDTINKLPLCNYLLNRTNCAENFNNVIKYDLRSVQDSLLAYLQNISNDTSTFFIPRLISDLSIKRDSDNDGIIDYLDPCPGIYNSDLQSTGMISYQNLEGCCGVDNPSGPNNIIADGTQAQLLAKWMFGVSQDFNEGNPPICAEKLIIPMIENADGTFRLADTCKIEFYVDCDCKCQFLLKDDYDGDGICNANDTYYGPPPCEITCPEMKCHVVMIKDCDCKYIPINKDSLQNANGEWEYFPKDSDNDGVCDYLDECPGIVDGGDQDGDGITDCIDECDGGFMGVPNPDIPTPSGPGDPCDDGNPCTYGDSISINCNCEGILLDFDDDSISDCGDCKIYFDDPATPNVKEWILVDPYSQFIPCNQCYSVMSDTDSIPGPDKVCDICPNLPDTLDYNNNGIPDCIDPPFKEIGCPAGYAFIKDPPGIMLSFNTDDIELEDLPNPIGLSVATEGSGQNVLTNEDYLPYSFTREVDGKYEVFYPMPEAISGGLIYAGVSYAGHQNCPLTSDEPLATVPCPSGIAVATDGSLLLLTDLPAGINADLLDYYGNYTINLTSTVPGNANVNTTVALGGSEIISTGGNAYSLNIGTVPGYGSFNNYSGSITLPNGTVCPYTAGALKTCANGLVLGNPCNDLDTCTHHDRVQMIGGNCECKGDDKPDSDNDGVCDEIDPCPDKRNTGPDNNGDGLPDCPCPALSVAGDSLTGLNDFNLGLNLTGSGAIDHYIVTIAGGPDGSYNDTLGNTMPLVVPNLPKGYPITLTITGMGETGCLTAPLTVNVDVPFDTDPAFCGVSLSDFNIGNSIPVPQLLPDDVFKAYDFNVVVRNATGSNGRFTGKGFIEVPYFNLIRVNVKYKDIFVKNINDKKLLTSGFVEVTGFGQNIIGDDIIKGLDSLINILETVDDVIENITDIVEDIEELVETTGTLVDSSHVACIMRATSKLDSLSKVPNVSQALIDQAKEELETCKDNYKQALAEMLDHIFIVMMGKQTLTPPVQGIVPFYSNCDAITLKQEFETQKAALKTYLETDSTNVRQSLNLGGSGTAGYNEGDVHKIVKNIPSSELSQTFVNSVNEFYRKESDYQFCVSLNKLGTEIQTLQQAKDLIQLILEAGNDFIPILGPEIKNNTNAQGVVDYNTVVTNTKSKFKTFFKKLLIHKGYEK